MDRAASSPSVVSMNQGDAEHQLLAAAPLDLPEDDGEAIAELAAALRTHVSWLQAGGVSGLPRPAGTLLRSPRPAPPPPAAEPRAVEPRAVENVRREVPERTEADYIEGTAAAALAAVAGAPRTRPARPTAAANLPSREDTAALGEPAPWLPPSPPPSAAPARTGGAIVEASYPELAAAAGRTGSAGLTTVREVLGDCKRCKLCHGRNKLVFGRGSATPWLVFVGEGPGGDEDRTGLPFVGAAGQLLDAMITAMANKANQLGLPEIAAHLDPEAVYICNVVKCRPPGNRTPEPDEIAACAPFLRAQLASVRPHVRALVALGRTPTQYLLQTGAPISKLRGRFSQWEGLPVMPTYHPAYLLRTPSAKRQVWEDLQQVIELLKQPPQT